LYFEFNYLGPSRPSFLRKLTFLVKSSSEISPSTHHLAVVLNHRACLKFYLLTIDYDPYIASMTSQGISTIVYMIVVNLSVIMTRLYKDGN